MSLLGWSKWWCGLLLRFRVFFFYFIFRLFGFFCGSELSGGERFFNVLKFLFLWFGVVFCMWGFGVVWMWFVVGGWVGVGVVWIGLGVCVLILGDFGFCIWVIGVLGMCIWGGVGLEVGRMVGSCVFVIFFVFLWLVCCNFFFCFIYFFGFWLNFL